MMHQKEYNNYAGLMPFARSMKKALFWDDVDQSIYEMMRNTPDQQKFVIHLLQNYLGLDQYEFETINELIQKKLELNLQEFNQNKQEKQARDVLLSKKYQYFFQSTFPHLFTKHRHLMQTKFQQFSQNMFGKSFTIDEFQEYLKKMLKKASANNETISPQKIMLDFLNNRKFSNQQLRLIKLRQDRAQLGQNYDIIAATHKITFRQQLEKLRQSMNKIDGLLHKVNQNKDMTNISPQLLANIIQKTRGVKKSLPIVRQLMQGIDQSDYTQEENFQLGLKLQAVIQSAYMQKAYYQPLHQLSAQLRANLKVFIQKKISGPFPYIFDQLLRFVQNIQNAYQQAILYAQQTGDCSLPSQVFGQYIVNQKKNFNLFVDPIIQRVKDNNVLLYDKMKKITAKMNETFNSLRIRCWYQIQNELKGTYQHQTEKIVHIPSEQTVKMINILLDSKQQQQLASQKETNLYKVEEQVVPIVEQAQKQVRIMKNQIIVQKMDKIQEKRQNIFEQKIQQQKQLSSIILYKIQQLDQQFTYFRETEKQLKFTKQRLSECLDKQKQYYNNWNECRKKVGVLQQDSQQIKQKILTYETMEKNYYAIERKLATKQSQIKAIKQRCTNFQSQLQRYKDSQDQVNKLNDQIVRVKQNQAKILSDTIDNAKSDKKEAENQIANLKRQIAKLNRQNDRLDRLNDQQFSKLQDRQFAQITWNKKSQTQ